MQSQNPYDQLTSCILQHNWRTKVVSRILPSVALGCTLMVFGGCSSGGDTASITGQTPAPQPVEGLAGIAEAPNIPFTMTTNHTMRVDLTSYSKPITPQTFIKVYRLDIDGSKHLIATQRLSEGMTSTLIQVLLPSSMSPNLLRAEIYSPSDFTGTSASASAAG